MFLRGFRLSDTIFSLNLRHVVVVVQPQSEGKTKTSRPFFALFISDKLIEVSELVMPVASCRRPRVNDNINLSSSSLVPCPPYHTLGLAHSSPCDFVWKRTSFPSSAAVKTITHCYQRHSRPHQTAGPPSLPHLRPPERQMANGSTLTLWLSLSASNLKPGPPSNPLVKKSFSD